LCRENSLVKTSGHYM